MAGSCERSKRRPPACLAKHLSELDSTCLAATLSVGLSSSVALASTPLTTADDAVRFENVFRQGKADGGGVRLHYVIGGHGPTLVLIHGFPATWYEWRGVMAKLAEHFTVVAVDLPGLGDSDAPASGFDAFTMGEEVRDLVAGLRPGPVFVVGHDIGAPIAYAYAAQHRQEVEGLALIEGVLAGAGLEELVSAAGPKLWHFTFQSVPDLPEALVAGRERIYFSMFYRPFAFDPSRLSDDEIDEYVRAYSTPGALRAAFGFYREQGKTAERIRDADRVKLAIPVLALAGDHSLGTPDLHDPAKASAEAVASNVQYEVVTGSGHWIPEERPEWLAARLIQFFLAPTAKSSSAAKP